MPCPYCSSDSIITRHDYATTQRTRRCLSCGKTWTTVEIPEVQQVSVEFTRHLLDTLTSQTNAPLPKL